MKNVKQTKTSHTMIQTNSKEISTQSDSESDSSQQSSLIVEMTPDKSYGRFNEVMGSGSFKQVYKGYDFNEGREIAWSVVKIDTNFDKIYEEISIMKRLDHPNIIKYVNGWYDKEKKEVVIITEILPGGSIIHYLRFITTSPRLRLIKSWIREILIGLDYLHTKINPPIIHCDIKCENIFIDRLSGKIKIGDLGGCEVLRNSYATHYVGTEEFMAPEVIEGKYTTKADIYSLGMCIIQMITLEVPYKECGGAALKIYDNVKKGILPRALKRIKNEKMVEIIKMCLRKEKDRPTARELLQNEFLNDTESKENDHPIQFRDIRDVDKVIEKKITNKSSGVNEESKIKADVDIGLNMIHSSNNVIKAVKKSFFDISIYENTEIVTDPKKKILNLTFVVDKKEWLKTKQIDFEYYLDKDTIEEVVTELTNCINLTPSESEIVTQKLSKFLSKYMKTQKERAEQFEIFNASYNRILTKIKKLINSKDSQKLKQMTQILNTFEKEPNTHKKVIDMLNDYNNKINHIQSVFTKHKIDN